MSASFIHPFKSIEHFFLLRPLHRMKLESHDEQRDLSVLKGAGDWLILTSGCFILLWPEEAHMPGLQADRSGPVCKIILKIAL